MGMKATKKISYGLNQPLIDSVPEPIISNRAPSSKDKLEAGTLWVHNFEVLDSHVSNTYILTNYVKGLPRWFIMSTPVLELATCAAPMVTAAFPKYISRGSARFSGYTIANGVKLDLAITSDLIKVGSPILITASNLGANDAQISILRVETTAGTAEVKVINNGAQALNGDIILTVDLMSSLLV